MRNLASLYNITHPTVLQSIRRRIPAHSNRLAETLPLEHIIEYRTMYYANLDTVRPLSPLLVASWLIDNTELDTDK